MVCRCEDSNYNKFIAGVFQQCITGTSGVTSFIFGWVSIVSWILACLPQIRANYLVKRSEAMSMVFILCWIVGDTFNLIACFILGQLFTQKVLSIVYVVFDVILVSQHFYYLKPKNQTQGSSTKFKALESVVYVFIAASLVNNILWGGFYNSFGLGLQEMTYGLCPSSLDLSHKSAQYIIGNILAYAAIPLYVTSRPGQIIKNHKRKTAVGLSVGMFCITISGNGTQLISLFAMTSDSSYLVSQIPFILGALLPALCDVFIVIQWFVFSQYDKKRINRKEMIDSDSKNAGNDVELHAANISIMPIQGTETLESSAITSEHK
ncbi:Seven_transmembrane protein 1 [Hexamita inflata]|uniref:Seven transmembrane protein 1 n=1 Tax=Hexamita inflata TaxID=28002 RepID=A0AA86PE79_9EUKA|nr:Seven transmembrane protein 1 [Hexamita inflata]